MIGASLIAQLVKNSPAVQETRFNTWVGKIRWRRDGLPTPLLLGFPCDSAGKEPTCNVGDLGSIPGLGRSPGEGKGYPLQYSGLENSIGCIVHGVSKSQTRLSNFQKIKKKKRNTCFEKNKGQICIFYMSENCLYSDLEKRKN